MIMSNKKEDQKEIDKTKDALPEGVSGLVPQTTLDLEKEKESEEEVEEGEKLKEFKEYEIEITKDYNGLAKGDKQKVSGNVATALIEKKIAKLV